LSYGDQDNNGIVNSAEIVEENNYYAFGLIQKGYNSATNYGKGNAAGQKYKYNNKEFQDELRLNMYDYGARNYDATLGRWMNIDPLAEKFERWTPYNYCMNNPIYFVDPNGMDVSNYYERNNVQVYTFTGRGVEDESSKAKGGLVNPVYGSDGKYRGNTLEGFTGVPIIYDGPADFSKLNAGALLTLGGRYFNFQLTPNAQANMINNIVQGTEYFINLFYDNISDKTFSFGAFLKPAVFQISELRGGSTSVNLGSRGEFNNPGNSVGANFSNRLFPDGSYSITSYGSLSFEPTVENIRATIIIHEGLVHGKWGFGDRNSMHRIAYLAVINSNLFNNTTANFKAHNFNSYANYSSLESPKELDEVIIGGKK
jgi:RHS repeat-associated protein